MPRPPFIAARQRVFEASSPGNRASLSSRAASPHDEGTMMVQDPTKKRLLALRVDAEFFDRNYAQREGGSASCRSS